MIDNGWIKVYNFVGQMRKIAWAVRQILLEYSSNPLEYT